MLGRELAVLGRELAVLGRELAVLGRELKMTFGKAFSVPLFNDWIIAALVPLVVGSATVIGFSGALFDGPNERECAEYLLDSRLNGRMSIGPSSAIDSF